MDAGRQDKGSPGQEVPGEPPWCQRSPAWLAAAFLAWLILSELANSLFLPGFSLLDFHLFTLLSATAGAAFLAYYARRGYRFWQEAAVSARLHCARALEAQREAEAQLADCQERYRLLVEFSPDPIVMHQDGRLVLVNTAAVKLVGGSSDKDLLGRDVMAFVSPECRELVAARMRQILEEEGVANRAEIRLLRLDGQPVEVESAGVRLPFRGQPAVLAILRDITERRRAETALRESEARFRSIFLNAPIGIGLMELDGRGLEINPAFLAMLGYSQEEICRLATEDLLHPDDVAERRRLIQEMREGRRQAYTREARYIRKDGSLLWVRLHVSLIAPEAGRPPLLLAMAEDISKEKETAALLATNQERLRSLAAELSLTEERERRLLAGDLHDHVGQPLALAKIKLAALREALAWEGRSAEVEEPLRYLEDAIAASRSLTAKLSPPLLFEEGLADNIAWLADQMGQRHHLAIQVHQGADFPRELPETVRVMLYRAVQEVLINAVKHARAKNVQIFLDKPGPELCITIQDDGIGFKVEEISKKSASLQGFGLFSLKERLGLIGARLEITSKPAEGTAVTIRAPLPG